MADAKNAFETSDKVSLKGDVKGVTRLSKNAKALMGVGGLLLMGFILFSIFTMGSDDGTQTASNDDTTQEQDKGKQGPQKNTPSAPGEVVKDIGDGQAAAAPPANPLDPRGTGALGPGFDVKNGAGPAGVVVPAVAGASAPAPVDLSKYTTGPGGARTAGVIVPSTAGTSDTDLKNVNEQQRQPTPQERRDMALAEDRAQARALARKSAAEVSWGGTGGSGDSPSVAAMPALNDLKTQLQALTGGQSGAAAAAGGGLPRAISMGGGQDDPNKQQRKEQFMKDAQANTANGYLKQLVNAPVSKFELKRGWVIPAVLQDAINSDLPGEVCARVRENVRDSATGSFILIPQGTVACGVYDSQVAVGQTRLLMAWQRLTFPDGSVLSLEGMPGADQSGASGFDGDVNNHYVKIFGGALMMSVVSTGVQMSNPPPAAGSLATPTAGQVMSQAVAQQVGQVSSSLIQRNMQIQPTISQTPGYRFNIRVTKDIVFPSAYKDSRLGR